MSGPGAAVLPEERQVARALGRAAVYRLLGGAWGYPAPGRLDELSRLAESAAAEWSPGPAFQAFAGAEFFRVVEHGREFARDAGREHDSGGQDGTGEGTSSDFVHSGDPAAGGAFEFEVRHERDDSRAGDSRQEGFRYFVGGRRSVSCTERKINAKHAIIRG